MTMPARHQYLTTKTLAWLTPGMNPSAQRQRGLELSNTGFHAIDHGAVGAACAARATLRAVDDVFVATHREHYAASDATC